MDAEQEQLVNAETPVLDIVFRHIYFLRISQTVISRLLGRYDLTDRKKNTIAIHEPLPCWPQIQPQLSAYFPHSEQH